MVGEGEMYGVGKLLERVEEEYRGEKRKLIIGVDNQGVLKKLRRSRGINGKAKQIVRRIGKRFERKGWEIKIVYVLGYVEMEENEIADKMTKEGCWDNVKDKKMGSMLLWGKWKQRRKEIERKR